MIRCPDNQGSTAFRKNNSLILITFTCFVIDIVVCFTLAPVVHIQAQVKARVLNTGVKDRESPLER